MTTQLHYKLLADLTMDELYVYAIHIGHTTIPSRINKDQICRLILEKEPVFLDDAARKFFFKKVEETNPRKVTLYYVSDVTDENPYTQRRLVAKHKLDHERLKEEIRKERDQGEKSEASVDLGHFTVTNDELIDRTITGDVQTTSTDPSAQLLQLIEQVQTTSSRRNFPLQQKLKYEPSHGIEAFIRSVESYANSYGVTDEERWISMAQTALLASEDGLLLQEALSPAEQNNWDLFKKKLISILGNPPDYYRDYFRSFRRGSQKLGLAMSRLTQAYRRGFLENAELSEHDKRHIMLQFIASLDNPLRGLVRAEEKSLKFETISERAAELERCFGQGFGPESTAALMFPEGRVQMVNAVNQQKAQESLQVKMMELLSNLTHQSEQMLQQMKNGNNQSRNNGSSRNGNGNNGQNRNGNNGRNFTRGRTPTQKKIAEVADRLNGFCFYYAKFNNCRKSDCTYKHDNIPEEIRKLVQ